MWHSGSLLFALVLAAAASDWLARGPTTPSAQQSAFVDITIIFAHHQYLGCSDFVDELSWILLSYW